MIVKCICGSDRQIIKYGEPCDYGYVKCLTCGRTGEFGETRKEIEENWENLVKKVKKRCNIAREEFIYPNNIWDRMKFGAKNCYSDGFNPDFHFDTYKELQDKLNDGRSKKELMKLKRNG